MTGSSVKQDLVVVEEPTLPFPKSCRIERLKIS